MWPIGDEAKARPLFELSLQLCTLEPPPSFVILALRVPRLLIRTAAALTVTGWALIVDALEGLLLQVRACMTYLHLHRHACTSYIDMLSRESFCRHVHV